MSDLIKIPAIAKEIIKNKKQILSMLIKQLLMQM
jgi:hypothetical protein